MAKTINITDKLSTEKPVITIGEKSYTINDSMETVFKFEELASAGNQGMIQAMEMALGAEACEELNIKGMSVGNFKVLTTALLAAMQGSTYEEAAARFQR